MEARKESEWLKQQVSETKDAMKSYIANEEQGIREFKDEVGEPGL